MKSPPNNDLLHAMITVLVRHYGAANVRAAIETKVGASVRRKMNEASDADRASVSLFDLISEKLKAIRENRDGRYEQLEELVHRFERREVLKSRQDLIYVGDSIGLKEKKYKDREAFFLAIFDRLLDLRGEDFSRAMQMLPMISEEERQRGFSRLADKLLKNK